MYITTKEVCQEPNFLCLLPLTNFFFIFILQGVKLISIKYNFLKK